MITVTTDMGIITLPKSVIGSIVMDVIDSFDGKVISSDPKGRMNRLAQKLGPKGESGNIEMEQTANGIDLRIFVVLTFGTSIKNTTERMIGEIRSEIKAASGINVENISVVITGMLTKNKLAPRYIEVTG